MTMDTTAKQIRNRTRYQARVHALLDHNSNPQRIGAKWGYYPAAGLWEQMLSVVLPNVSRDGRTHWIECLAIWDRDLWEIPDAEWSAFQQGEPTAVARWHANNRPPQTDGGFLDAEQFALVSADDPVG